MFDKIVVRECSAGENLFDPGVVAEALLFYGKVHFLVNQGATIAIADAIGPDNLLRILDSGAASLTILDGSFGTRTTTINGISCHDYVGTKFERDKDGKRLDAGGLTKRAFEQRYGVTRETKKLVSQILSLAEIRDPSKEAIANKPLPLAAFEDLADARYVEFACQMVLRHQAPQFHIPTGSYFRIVPLGTNQFGVDTNLDFNAINEAHRQHTRSAQSTLTDAWVLNHILEARLDSYFAADYMSELLVGPTRSHLMQQRFEALIKRRQHSASAIDVFQETAISDTPTVRDAINSGERSFAEFLELLEKAQRFKQWLQEANPDANLIREYLKAVSAVSWLDSMPTKTTRWGLFTGAGLALDLLVPTGLGTAAGVAAGAIDTFLIDKILGGWKPNQFIQGPLAEFVRKHP